MMKEHHKYKKRYIKQTEHNNNNNNNNNKHFLKDHDKYLKYTELSSEIDNQFLLKTTPAFKSNAHENRVAILFEIYAIYFKRY